MRHTIQSSMLIAFALLAALPARGGEVLRDLAYGPNPAQRLDVYLPAGARMAPIIVLVHGGAWIYGDKASRGIVANKAARWLPRGNLIVSVNYRLAYQVHPDEQARDIGRAMAFIQAQAHSWGGDPNRMVLMGHSAGAHLVALLGVNGDLAKEAGIDPWLGTIALDTAAYDVPAIMERAHHRLYDRAFGSDPEGWRRASPIHNIAGRPAPMLLVCSALRADSCAASSRFQEALKARGVQAELLRVSYSHSILNRDLGLAGDYTDAVDAFMRSLGLP